MKADEISSDRSDEDNRPRRDGFDLPAPAYKSQNSLVSNDWPHASRGWTTGSQWFQSGSCSEMGISRGFKFPSGRNATGVMCGTIALQSSGFARPFGADRVASSPPDAKMYGSVAVSLSSAHDSPAP